MKLPGLFGKSRAPAWTGDPEATPIHAWLDAAGFPWRMLRSELAERYGVAADPNYGWPVISIPTDPPLLEGLLGPFSAQAFDHISTRAPAVAFSAVTWFGDDARANAERTAAHLEPLLGPIRLGRQNNTFGGLARFGPSSVRLTTWPADLQYGGAYENAAEDREPRLKTGCHVHLETGYRAAPTAEEAAWLATFTPIARLQAAGAATPAAMRKTPASGAELPYVRTLPDAYGALIGQVGMSADGRGVVLCQGQLYVIPIGDLREVRYVEVLPARGPGAEWVQLVCADADGVETVLEVGPSQVMKAEDLAALLADRLGRPLERPEPTYDV